MTSLQLNNVIDWMAAFAKENPLINDFGYGPKVNARHNLKMPYLWVRPLNSPITNGVNNSTITYNIEVIVMDRIDVSNNNYADIVNDTNYIIQMLVAELKYNLRYIDPYAKLEDNIEVEMVMEDTDNDVNGNRAVFSIKTPLRLTGCNIPKNNSNC